MDQERKLCVDECGQTSSIPKVSKTIHFHGIYEEMLEGCKPMIGLDGCFLKWQFKGQLLAIVGRDGNNNIYPIAFAVIEVETKNS